MEVLAISARCLKQVTNLKQVIYLKEITNLKQVTIHGLCHTFVNIIIIFIACLSKDIKETLKSAKHTFLSHVLAEYQVCCILTPLYNTGRSKREKGEKICFTVSPQICFLLSKFQTY